MAASEAKGEGKPVGLTRRMKSLEEVTAASLYNTWAIGGLQEEEVEQLQRSFDEHKIRECSEQHRGTEMYGIWMRCKNQAHTDVLYTDSSLKMPFLW